MLCWKRTYMAEVEPRLSPITVHHPPYWTLALTTPYLQLKEGSNISELLDPDTGWSITSGFRCPSNATTAIDTDNAFAAHLKLSCGFSYHRRCFYVL
ncbi:hypothetical protein TNCV_2383001 [Trichonephila clavipes]|nr:hypothetical protein TNCV_2383001 [Trichonephila clavipes]